MERNVKINDTEGQLSVTDQLKAAKILLNSFYVFHPALGDQLKLYTVACCGISLGGFVKVDVHSKSVIFNIYT